MSTDEEKAARQEQQVKEKEARRPGEVNEKKKPGEVNEKKDAAGRSGEVNEK
jgi:hypothetical protein